MRQKKAIELSMNFLVVIIIGIIVFAGSLALVKKFFFYANKYQDQIDKDTQAEIEKLLENGERVAIPIDKKSGKIGDGLVFGLGIYNVLRSGDQFNVSVRFKRAYDIGDNSFFIDTSTDANGGDYIDSNWHFFKDPLTYKIENNEYLLIPIKILIGANSDDELITHTNAVYIFDVNVTAPNGELYDGKIHKIYVEVE
jgi:hypothetical protein